MTRTARVAGLHMGMVGFMVLAQRKVLLLAADDFEDIELLYPLYRGRRGRRGDRGRAG